MVQLTRLAMPQQYLIGEQDSKRCAPLSAEFSDIVLDYSRQRVTSDTMVVQCVQPPHLAMALTCSCLAYRTSCLLLPMLLVLPPRL